MQNTANDNFPRYPMYFQPRYIHHFNDHREKSSHEMQKMSFFFAIVRKVVHKYI